MPPPTFLANENVPYVLLQLLRERGLDVQHVGQIMPIASDRVVLQYAHQQQRWLLTFDRDYGELVFARLAPPPPAILSLRQGPQSMADFAQAVMAVLPDVERLRGHLVVIKGRSVRLRPLPS